MNKDIPELGKDLQNRDLHNKKLIFLNTNRPAKRYLYFMYCITLYKARERHRSEAGAEELASSRKVWATLGPYIRRNMSETLAANLDHDFADVLQVEEHAVPSDKVDEEVSRY